MIIQRIYSAHSWLTHRMSRTADDARRCLPASLVHTVRVSLPPLVDFLLVMVDYFTVAGKPDLMEAAVDNADQVRGDNATCPAAVMRISEAYPSLHFLPKCNNDVEG